MAKVKTIRELIEMKSQIEEKNNKVKSYYVASLDMEFKFKQAKRTDLLQIQEMEREDQDTYFIYQHVIEPNLADKELQEAYNSACPPHHIVDKLLSIKEVGELSLAIIGQLEGNLVKDVKN